MKWLGNIIEKVDPPIDYIGQYLALRVVHTILICGVFLSLLFGYLYKDIFTVGYVYGATCLLAVILVVPSWPFFRRNPVWGIEEKVKPE